MEWREQSFCISQTLLQSWLCHQLCVFGSFAKPPWASTATFWTQLSQSYSNQTWNTHKNFGLVNKDFSFSYFFLSNPPTSIILSSSCPSSSSIFLIGFSEAELEFLQRGLCQARTHDRAPPKTTFRSLSTGSSSTKTNNQKPARAKQDVC